MFFISWQWNLTFLKSFHVQQIIHDIQLMPCLFIKIKEVVYLKSFHLQEWTYDYEVIFNSYKFNFDMVSNSAFFYHYLTINVKKLVIYREEIFCWYSMKFNQNRKTLSIFTSCFDKIDKLNFLVMKALSFLCSCFNLIIQV